MERRCISQVFLVGCVICGQAVGLASAQVSAERASDCVEMVAGLDLGLNEPVKPADYELAMNLLNMGLGLDPEDADMARQVVQAAWNAGDNEALIDATRMVIRSDPKDTVATLRLISAIVNREQTVEGRIASYNRFLGERGEGIDVTVRSRLMLDLALLERERGNESGFLSALRKSAKLDPANKEPQSLVSQNYSRTIAEASTLLRLQLRVLYADPIDPHVYITIARLCAVEGATDAAWRFLNNGIDIFKIDVGITPPILQEQQLALLWQHEGPQAILDELNPSLADERAVNALKIEARKEADEPFDDITPPEDIRYEAGIDRIRLLAASILEDQETVDSVLLDLRRGLVSDMETMKEQMNIRGVNRGVLLGEYLRKVVSFQTMRAIVGVDHSVIKEDIDQMIEVSPELEQFFRPFEPFSEFAKGNFARAKEIAQDSLDPSVSRDMLLARSTEQVGDTDEAIELYIQMTRDYPLKAAGAMARSRLKELTNGAQLRTEEGTKMEEIARRVPAWFDQMIQHPENTMDLSIVPSKISYEPGEVAKLRIRVTNLSTLPLGLGGTHPIDSNLLIVPGFSESERGFRGIGRARVVDLGRRFRLDPLESLVIELEPDSVQSRWLIQNQPQSVVRQRWRALQGFQPSPNGGIINSPFGLVSETQLVGREVLGEASASADIIIESIRSPETNAFERGVLAASAVLLKPEIRADLSPEDFARIVDALWDRYVSGDVPTKVWMLGTLPTKLAAGPIESFDERVQQELVAESLINPEIEPVLVAMVLITRVESMSSPVIEVANAHDDPRLGLMAQLVVERIENIEPMYAGVDNPLEAFSGKADSSLGD